MESTKQPVKCCLMTSRHPTFDHRIFHKEAPSLQKAGYDVAVIGRWDDPPAAIRGVALFAFSALQTWMLRLRLRWLFKMLKVVPIGFRVNADVYHCLTEDMLPSALVLRFLQRVFRRKRAFVIHEIRDFYLREAFLDKPPGFRKRIRLAIWEFFDRIMQRCCDFIIGTEDSKLALSRSYGIPEDRLIVIPHYVQLELFSLETKQFDPRNYVVAYSGGLSFYRGIDKLAEACVAVAKRRGIRIQLRLVGIWHAKKEQEEFDKYCEDHRSWIDVQYKGYIPHADVAGVLAPADVCCSVFCSKRYARVLSGKEPPVKLYEYMACGKPTIASDLPGLRYNIEKGECGLLVDVAGGTNAIADAIEYYYDNPEVMREHGANGRRAAGEWFCWPIAEKMLLDLYARLLSQREALRQ